MPLKTFLNLPGNRKKEIINVCLKEFAHNDYESTSLSGIIKKLHLAKGSFYRYFESKKELYFYLFEYLGDLIRPYANTFLKQTEKPFVESVYNYYLGLFEIEKEYPFYLRFLFKVRTEQNKKILKDIKYKKARNKHLFIKELLESHQEKGYIRNDVDINLLILLFSRMIPAFFDYLSSKYRLDLSGNKGRSKPVSSLDEKDLNKEINVFINTIKGVFITS